MHGASSRTHHITVRHRCVDFFSLFSAPNMELFLSEDYSGQSTLNFQLATSCQFVYPTPDPALWFLLMHLACPSLPCREFFQFAGDLLSWVIYLCLSRSPAWVKRTTDLSFHQLLISGLLSVAQPGKSSGSGRLLVSRSIFRIRFTLSTP